MALDEPRDDDEVSAQEGFTLVADRKLLDESGGITVDYLTGPFRKGFQIKANSSACGSSCGDGC